MTALRPGTQVVVQDLAPPVGITTDTGAWFVAGLTEKGSTTAPVKIQNMSDYATYLGARVAYGQLYDALDTFFREGGKTAYVSRVVGATPVVAFKNLNDGAAAVTLKVSAENAGAWGNSLKVGVVAGVGGGSTFQLQITDAAGNILEQSPDLTTKADAIAWGSTSNYVNVTDPGTGVVPPAIVAPATMATGTDDQGTIADAHWLAALDRLTSDLGPGQVSAPGRTTSAAYAQLLLHAANHNRVALMDAVDTATVATLTVASLAQRLDVNARYGSLWGPWVQIPGLVPNTIRTVPPSAVAAGLIGRSDANGSPALAAAGANGVSRYAIGVSQAAWTDAQRDTLNSAGVNTIRAMFGQIKAYGFRTLADPTLLPNWVQLSQVRLFMAVVAKGNAILEGHVFRLMDGRRLEFAALGGELKGMLVPYWEDNSLYGGSPGEAFSVDVSDAVNTPTTIAAGELHALVSLRVSPFAELVVLQLVKVPITQSLT